MRNPRLCLSSSEGFLNNINVKINFMALRLWKNQSLWPWRSLKEIILKISTCIFLEVLENIYLKNPNILAIKILEKNVWSNPSLSLCRLWKKCYWFLFLKNIMETSRFMSLKVDKNNIKKIHTYDNDMLVFRKNILRYLRFAVGKYSEETHCP